MPGPVKSPEDRPRSPPRGPARVAQCPDERRTGARGAALVGEIGERARGAIVEHGEALTAGVVTEGASKPRLADAGWADDDQMMMVADPFAGGELEEQGAVEAAVCPEVDVLDNRGLAQPSLAQTAGGALVLAVGPLAIHEQPEPILPRQLRGIGGVLHILANAPHGPRP